MKFYLDIIRFNFLEELAYPIEIVAYIFRRILSIGLLIVFWLAIASTNTEVFDFRQLISYFLIAGAVEDLTFTSTGGWDRSIRKMVKTGLLSNFLIKPINILRFWFSSYVGSRTTITIWGLITLIIGICLYPPANLSAIPLFLLSLVFTTAAGAGINILVGIVAFYTPEAGGISNVVDHVTNILSGHVIPLNYFPVLIRKFTLLTPFPVLTYFPVTILQQGGLNQDTFTKLGLSLLWAVLLLTLGNIAWKKAIKNYDGVGI